MSSINPNIKKILLLDVVLFFIGLAGIYQLVERAGFNTSSDLDLRVSDSNKLVIEKIINRSSVYGIIIIFLLTLYMLIIAIAMKVIDIFTTESSIRALCSKKLRII